MDGESALKRARSAGVLHNDKGISISSTAQLPTLDSYVRDRGDRPRYREGTGSQESCDWRIVVGGTLNGRAVDCCSVCFIGALSSCDDNKDGQERQEGEVDEHLWPWRIRECLLARLFPIKDSHRGTDGWDG